MGLGLVLLGGCAAKEEAVSPEPQPAPATAEMLPTPEPLPAPRPATTVAQPAVPAAATQTLTSKDQDLKPWIFGDPCAGIESDDYLCFVGQNAVNVAARGNVPPRSAWTSAEANAKAQYVQYMENLVQVKTNEALRSAGDDIEGQQTVAALKDLSKQFSKRTVTGLKPFDSEYASQGVNSAGIPLWKVWKRMRIEKDAVREKFGQLSENVQSAAKKGVENAKDMAEAIRSVEEEMTKNDDFFKGF